MTQGIPKQAELHYQNLFEKIPIGIYRAAPHGEILLANPELLRIIGYESLEELAGRNLSSLRQELVDGDGEFGSILEKDGMVRGFNSTWIRKDRSLVAVRENARSILDPLGNPLYYEGTVEDLSGRLQTPDVQVFSMGQNHSVLDHLMEGCQIIDSDWRYVYVNEAVAQQGRRARYELLNHTMMEIYPGIENTALFATLQKCMKERTAERMKNEFEFPDGSTGWFELRIEPVPEGIFILSIDITKRKKAEANAQKQLKRLAALRDIDLAITSSTDFRVTLNVLLEKVADDLKVDAADVMLLDPFTHVLEYAAGQGFRSAPNVQASQFRMGEGLPGRIALDRKPVFAPEISDYRDSIVRKDLMDLEGFRSYFGVPLIVKGKVIGVLEAYNRSKLDPDGEWYAFLEALGGQAAIAIDSSFLFNNLQRSHLDLIRAYDSTIEGWSAALDLRDKETEGHTLRVTGMTLQLAEKMGFRPEQLIHIRRGALLHDIGKMGVPDPILLKPGPLTTEEWEIMEKHPQLAHDLLAPIQYLQGAIPIPYCHHEKWDGTGYPRGLKGEQIPLEARIFAVIDVWDALRSNRPYRAAWSRDKTLEYVKAESGKHFDPAVVESFLESGLIKAQ